MPLSQQTMSEKNKKIEKIKASEEKILNLMNNERKIFSNERRKLILQNQDLLVTYNSLNHTNKYLANVIKTQEDPRRTMRHLLTKRQKKASGAKPTPFQNFISMKANRRVKTTPCVIHDC